MSERYQSWWENVSPAKFLFESVLHPRVVKRQIMVAIERGQSPLTSDLENFQTLMPSEAGKLLAQWEKIVRERDKTK